MLKIMKTSTLKRLFLATTALTAVVLLSPTRALSAACDATSLNADGSCEVDAGGVALTGPVSVTTGSPAVSIAGVLSSTTDFSIGNTGTYTFSGDGQIKATNVLTISDGTYKGTVNFAGSTVSITGGDYQGSTLTLTGATTLDGINWGTAATVAADGLSINGNVSLQTVTTSDIGGTGTLTLGGGSSAVTGAVNANITLGTGAVFSFDAGSNWAGSALTLQGNAALNINNSVNLGNTLTFGTGNTVTVAASKSLTLGSVSGGSGSTITGDGTLFLSGSGDFFPTVSGENLTLSASGTVKLKENLKAKNVNLTGGTLTVSGSTNVVSGSLNISGGNFTVSGDTVLGGMAFTSNLSSIITIDASKMLTVDSDLSFGTSQKLSGTGTLKMGDTANLSYNNVQNFGGKIIVSKQADFAQTVSVNDFTFANETGGTLNIAAGKTLSLTTANLKSNTLTGGGTLNLVGGNGVTYTVGNLTAGAVIKLNSGTFAVATGKTLMSAAGITGAGNLSLTASNAVFSAVLAPGISVNATNGSMLEMNNGASFSGTMNLSGSTLVLNNTVSNNMSLTLGNGSTLTVGGGTTFTVSDSTEATQSDTINGSGTVVFTGSNPFVAKLNGGDLNAQINTSKVFNNTVDVASIAVAAGKTLTFNGALNNVAGTLNLGSSSRLNIGNNTSVGTVTADTYSTISIDSGKTLSVSSDITIGTTNTLTGSGTLELTGTAGLTYSSGNSTAFTGTLIIDQGTATFNTQATIGTLQFAQTSGGTLNLNGVQLTVGNIVSLGSNSVTGTGHLYSLNGYLFATVNTQIIRKDPISIMAGKVSLNDSNPTRTYPNGYYQASGNIISVAMNNNDIPNLIFNGGVLWDISSYIPGLTDQNASGYSISGEEVFNGLKFGRKTSGASISIANGLFEGAVQIYKGHNILEITESYQSGNDTVTEKRDVYSNGGIELSGGSFFFNKDSSILLRGTATGDLITRSGYYYVGYSHDASNRPVEYGGSGSVTIGSENFNQDVYFYGGQYYIAPDWVLRLQGQNVTLAKTNYETINLTGSGTLALAGAPLFEESYPGTVKIQLPISWETGTVRIDNGKVSIESDVTVSQLLFDSANLSALDISGKLTVKNGLKMYSTNTLTGKGELLLAGDAASETQFGNLTFGTLSVRQGKVSFTGTLSNIENLNMTEGTVDVGGVLVVGTLNMGTSTFNLSNSMTVTNLNFQGGKIVFQKDAVLQLEGDSNILNSTKFEIGASAPDNAKVIIGNARTLMFSDAGIDLDGDGTEDRFVSTDLNIVGTDQSFVNFNNINGTDLKSLTLSRSTANVNSGEVTTKNIQLGDTGGVTGSINVASGATATTETFLSYSGSTTTIDTNGRLNVGLIDMRGTSASWSTMAGGGTLNIAATGGNVLKNSQNQDWLETVSETGQSTYTNAIVGNLMGKLDNLSDIVIDATNYDALASGTYGATYMTVLFDGQTRADRIDTLTVKNGENALVKAVINGSLTLKSLSFGEHGGVIDIAQGAVLSLLESPDGYVGNANNIIGGKGSLELLNDTNMSFGGQAGLGYLGGLRIGTGTATVTTDTTIGEVVFTSEKGGTLTIQGGTVLTLDNNLISSGENTVNGGGILEIMKTGSVFGGEVMLGELKMSGAGPMTAVFNFGKTSQINTLSGGKTVEVNNGRLNISTVLQETEVGGTGTLYLQNGGTIFPIAGKGLQGLIVGDSNAVTFVKSSFTLGTLNFESADKGTVNIENTLTITNSIVTGAGNSLTGANLTLSGAAATGRFSGTLSALTGAVTLSNGATAFIDETMELINPKLILNSGTTLDIADGKKLTLVNSSQSDLGEAGALITGKGTLQLNKAGYMTVGATLRDLKKLLVSLGHITVTPAFKFLEDVDLAANTSLTAAAGGFIGGNVSVGSGSDFSSGTLDLRGNAVLNPSAQMTLAGGSVAGNVSVGSSATFNSTRVAVAGNVTVSENAAVNFSGGSIAGTLNFGTGNMPVFNMTADSTIKNIVYDPTSAANLNIGSNVLTVTGDISVPSTATITGNGTIVLQDAATATIGKDFAGTLNIGTGRAIISENVSVGTISFAGMAGGELKIADGKELSIGTIKTAGSNLISGEGILNLTGAGSEFRARIDRLGTLKVAASGQATFFNDISIGTLSFNGGGSIVLSGPVTTNISSIAQGSGTPGAIYGDQASLILGAGASSLSTGGNKLGALTVGSGQLTVSGNSHVGSLTFSAVTNVVSINSGVILQVDSDLNALGAFTGSGNLVLSGAANAVFNKPFAGFAGIESGTGSLTFNETVDMGSFSSVGGNVDFKRSAILNSASIGAANAVFRSNATIDNLTVGSGSVRFTGETALGTVVVGKGGSFRLDTNATVGTSLTSVGALIDLDNNLLDLGTGNAIFSNGSTLALRISRAATDPLGNVFSTGFGRIKAGNVEFRDSTAMALTIDYGVKVKNEGSVFHIIEGNKIGSMAFNNNRYSITEEACNDGGAGLCYRIVQTSNGAQVVDKNQGGANNSGTAGAFLDSELFKESDPIFRYAEHLDKLSQDSKKNKEYLGALTAIAPDVSGGMSRQTVIMQNKVSGMIGNRMNKLQGVMGNSSGTYRELQKMYGSGRSGGSPYQSRWMKSSDYYKRAGYIDNNNEPITQPKAPVTKYKRPSYGYDEQEDLSYGRKYSKKKATYQQPNHFGLWAQAFYNTADYLSANKPDGFSGDTTGVAFGADVEFLDVFALGAGYANTSSSVDSLQRKTDITGNSFFVYGMYKPSEWYLSSIINIGTSSFDEQKDISGLILKDTYDASNLGASLMYSYNLKTWTPGVGIRYSSVKRKAHTDPIGQNISSVTSNTFTAVAEGRWNKVFAKSKNALWHTDLVAALTYDFSSGDESASVQLPNGASYTVSGKSMNAAGLELGGTVAYVLGDHIDLSAGYNLTWKPDYTSHTLTLNFRYSF